MVYTSDVSSSSLSVPVQVWHLIKITLLSSFEFELYETYVDTDVGESAARMKTQTKRIVWV